MKNYRITLNHDAGRVRIIINGSSIAQAVEALLKIEHAPESAIVKVEVLK
jgi:uncharacterized protein (DUF427 family)